MILTEYDKAQCGLAEVPVNRFSSGEHQMKIEKLSKETGLSYSTIKNYLKKMTEEEVLKKGRNKSNRQSYGSVVYKGEVHTYRSLSELTGISKTRLGNLLRSGMSPEQAVRDAHKYKMNGSKIVGLKKEYRDA